MQSKFIPDYTEEDSEHWYLNTETGARVPSVTTIFSILKKPWLERWKTKEAINYIVETGDHDVDMALMASKKKGEIATTIGSNVHNTIEVYLKEWLKNKARPKKRLVHYMYPDFKVDPTTHLRYDQIGLQTIAGLRSAEKLFDQYEDVFEPVAVEICVGDVQHKYGGKLDLLCKFNGKLELWDWKTSVAIPLTEAEYPMQANGYRRAFEKEHKIKVSKIRIIQLSKFEDKFTLYEVEKSADLVKSFYALAKYYDTIITNNERYYREIRRSD